jgi:hypothetical protein
MGRIIDFASGEEIRPKANHSRFYALLGKMPHAVKEELVLGASGGKTESLNELWEFYPNEYDALLRGMQAEAGSDWMPYTYKAAYRKRNANVSPEVRNKRSELLRACAEWGISDKGDGCFWDNINRFLRDPRIAGKNIYEMYDGDEIQAVIRRIKTMNYNRERNANLKDHIKR